MPIPCRSCKQTRLNSGQGYKWRGILVEQLIEDILYQNLILDNERKIESDL